jgi:hypothetical protein
MRQGLAEVSRAQSATNPGRVFSAASRRPVNGLPAVFEGKIRFGVIYLTSAALRPA